MCSSNISQYLPIGAPARAFGIPMLPHFSSIGKLPLVTTFSYSTFDINSFIQALLCHLDTPLTLDHGTQIVPAP